jgi:GalNAc-alpha-(1->4)-GalNAc-alpha-(1->3)-diNAcBac-PP-undecaprenol alpha-1,4-N-acetyl-D-galactosaminyltransferase
MRILFVLNTLAMGGSERVSSILCNAWAAQGHKVLLVQSFSGGAQNFFNLDPTIRQEALGRQGGKRSPFEILRRMSKLRRLARQFQPDVIISFLNNVNLVMLIATAGLGMRRIVGERADPVATPIPKAVRWGCRLLYRFADMVLVQNWQQGVRLEGLYGRMPRLTSIANPLPDIVPARSARRGEGRRRIASLGRLEKSKQVDLVIRAFHRLAASHKSWELHIYGDGPARGCLETTAAAGPGAERIHFHGRTDRALEVLAASDLYASASAYEGFPNALMEAMAVGLPTLSTDCPCGPRDMTDDGEVGLLVPMDDEDSFTHAMAQLMDDEALRRSLGEKAAAHIRSLCGREVVLAQWQNAFARLGAA